MSKSLVEVTATFWKPGDKVCVDDLYGIWGSSYGDSYEKYTITDAESSCEEEQIEKFTDSAMMLTFCIVGNDPGEYSCYVDAMYRDDGTWIFQEWYEHLAEIAKEKMEAVRELRKEEKVKERKKQRKKKMRRRRRWKEPDIVRFITVWDHWESRSYEGECDYGIDLDGILDMEHLHLEGDKEHERRRQQDERKQRRPLRKRRVVSSHTRRAQGSHKHSLRGEL
jgi:hypothetical protein